MLDNIIECNNNNKLKNFNFKKVMLHLLSLFWYYYALFEYSCYYLLIRINKVVERFDIII